MRGIHNLENSNYVLCTYVCICTSCNVVSIICYKYENVCTYNNPDTTTYTAIDHIPKNVCVCDIVAISEQRYALDVAVLSKL